MLPLIDSLVLDKDEKEFITKPDATGGGLYAGADGGYGAAQMLYVKRGYITDGKGVTKLRTNSAR